MNLPDLGELAARGFLLMRHGESECNRDGKVAGQLDSPLTDQGRAEALRGARLLDHVEIGSIVASPLSRALETAEIVAAHRGMPVRIVATLMERHWGIYQGRPEHERKFVDDPQGGEGIEAFRARIIAALGGLRGPHPVLVVAHQGVARILVDTFGVADFGRFRLSNAVPIRVLPALLAQGRNPIVAI